jgi:hypothetical protein
MNEMFYNAKEFNQNISDWMILKSPNMTKMFDHSGYTYDKPTLERARELQNNVRNFRRIRVKAKQSDPGLSSSAIKVLNDPYLTRYMEKRFLGGKKRRKTRKRKYKSKKKNITRKRKQSRRKGKKTNKK